MPAATVELLVTKARLEPPIAITIAEAIDMAIQHSQLVTVPVLDALLADLKGELKGEIKDVKAELKMDIAALRSEMTDMKAELIRWVLLAMLGSSALAAATKALLDL